MQTVVENRRCRPISLCLPRPVGDERGYIAPVVQTGLPRSGDCPDRLSDFADLRSAARRHRALPTATANRRAAPRHRPCCSEDPFWWFMGGAWFPVVAAPVACMRLSWSSARPMKADWSRTCSPGRSTWRCLPLSAMYSDLSIQGTRSRHPERSPSSSGSPRYHTLGDVFSWYRVELHAGLIGQATGSI